MELTITGLEVMTVLGDLLTTTMTQEMLRNLEDVLSNTNLQKHALVPKE